MELTVVLVVLLALVSLTAHERHQRALERQELLDAHNQEREQWTRERQLLLNRIKPETAQAVLDPNLPPPAPVVHFDDDDGYWESRDDMAERMMREELEARRGIT